MRQMLTKNNKRNKKMTLKRGDIVWLKEEMPFVALGKNIQTCDRPYVVISNNINNSIAPTVNLACVSKQVKKAAYPMHVFLKKDKYGLKYDSLIYVEQMTTINKEYIKEKIASLDEEDLKELDRAVYVQLINENIYIESKGIL